MTELNRYVPRFNEGVLLLNESTEPLHNCDVLNSQTVSEARNNVTNTNIFMGATLEQLDLLEDLIRPDNNLEAEPSKTEMP